MYRYIPNFLTLINLFSGCMALVLIFSDQLIDAAWFVSFALVFDFLDGLTARLLKAPSAIGKQLDSLADVVSFGVVPGVIMYTLLKESVQDISGWSGVASLVPFLGFSITLFSALRLAKFNIDERQEDVFYGLPTPANAILIVSFPLILWQFKDSNSEYIAVIDKALRNTWVLVGTTVLSSFLLVSNIQLASLKFKSFRWADNSSRYLLLASSLVLIVFLKFSAIPLIVLLYFLLSFFANSQSNKL